MTDLLGKMLSVFLIFFLGILVPLCIMVTGRAYLNQQKIMNEMVSFLDEVADIGEVTDENLAAFQAACNSYGPLVDVTVGRYQRVVSPDPTSPGHSYTTYVYTDKIEHFNIGDKVTVHVKELGYRGGEQMLYRAFGVMIDKLDCTLAKGVRNI